MITVCWSLHFPSPQCQITPTHTFITVAWYTSIFSTLPSILPKMPSSPTVLDISSATSSLLSFFHFHLHWSYFWWRLHTRTQQRCTYSKCVRSYVPDCALMYTRLVTSNSLSKAFLLSLRSIHFEGFCLGGTCKCILLVLVLGML